MIRFSFKGRRRLWHQFFESRLCNSNIAAMMTFGRTHTFDKLSLKRLVSQSSVSITSLNWNLRVVQTGRLVNLSLYRLLFRFWILSIWNKSLEYLDRFINFANVCRWKTRTSKLVSVETCIVDRRGERLIGTMFDDKSLGLALLTLHI